jgi:hypothetical protein
MSEAYIGYGVVISDPRIVADVNAWPKSQDNKYNVVVVIKNTPIELTCFPVEGGVLIMITRSIAVQVPRQTPVSVTTTSYLDQMDMEELLLYFIDQYDIMDFVPDSYVYMP